MTDEQLKQAQNLKSRINSLKLKIGYWEKATDIAGIKIRYQFKDDFLKEYRSFDDDGNYVDFEVLKTLTLQNMKTKLAELEKEYREL